MQSNMEQVKSAIRWANFKNRRGEASDQRVARNVSRLFNYLVVCSNQEADMKNRTADIKAIALRD
eukprot:759529-Hanusia_phi.AAC.10